MDDATRQAHVKELAAIMHAAGTGQATGQQAASLAQSFGLFGGLDKQLWAAVATRLLNIIEEIAREQIDAWLIEHGGATGGLYATDPKLVPPKE